MGGNIFYDALLIDVSRHHHIDKVSGMGFGMGYLGGGILLAACVYLSQNAEIFGFSSTIDAVLFSFVLTAFWWLLFSMPLAYWVKESKPLTKTSAKPVSQIFKEVGQTFRHIFGNKQIALFLLAYWVYIDGVDTIIRMAVDYGLSIGFDSNDLIVALLITQFVGFPAAIIYTHIGDKVGIKNALIAGILVAELVYSKVQLHEY